MAGVSTPELAAAVSGAGGLGSIGVGAADAATAGEMIAATRARTDRAFNVNVFVHAAARADTVREAQWLETLRPLLIFLHEFDKNLVGEHKFKFWKCNKFVF